MTALLNLQLVLFARHPHLSRFKCFALGNPRDSLIQSTVAKKRVLCCPTLPTSSPFLTGERKDVMEKDQIHKSGRGTGEWSDDITGGLMCVRVEVLTSTVTGRGRTSVPYVGHIKNQCGFRKFSQLTNQPAKQRWSHNCEWAASSPWLWKFSLYPHRCCFFSTCGTNVHHEAI